MPLPPALSIQTLQGLSGQHYETARQTIQGHNDLLTALGPGTSISPASFALTSGLGVGASVSATNGSYKRGQFTLTVGKSGVGTNPTFTIQIPKGEFSGTPFVQLSQSGGSGTLPFSYSAAATTVTVTLTGTPTANTTYVFNHMMSD